MAETSNRSPLCIFGPLWVGGVLVATIISAFFNGAREFIASQNIVTYLLFFWVAMLPGLAMSLMADRGIPDTEG